MKKTLNKSDIERIEIALSKCRTGHVDLKIENGKLEVFVSEAKKV